MFEKAYHLFTEKVIICMKEGTQHAVLVARFHSWSLLQSCHTRPRENLILAESWLTANQNFIFFYKSTKFINTKSQQVTGDFAALLVLQCLHSKVFSSGFSRFPECEDSCVAAMCLNFHCSTSGVASLQFKEDFLHLAGTIACAVVHSCITGSERKGLIVKFKMFLVNSIKTLSNHDM